MKRYILLFIGLLYVCCDSVYAEDSTTEDSDVTWITSGYYTNSDEVNTYKYEYVTDVGLFILYNGSTYNVMAIANGSGSCDAEYSNSSGVYYQNSLSIKFDAYSAIASTSSIDDTDLPIFDNRDENYQDNLNAYIESGDTSGAVNAESFVEYDDSVELPKNFKIVDGYSYLLVNKILDKLEKDIVLSWNQTVDTSSYKYDVEVSFSYKGNLYKEYVGNKISLSGDDKIENEYEVTTPFMEYSSNSSYLGSKNVTCVLSCKVLNDMMYDYAKQNKHADMDDCMIIRKVTIRVRNKEGQGCSNYVSSTINFSEKSVTTSETDEDGVVVDDAEYDNDDGTISKDEQNDGKSSNGISLNGVMAFIRDGFGLLGNNGIIALLSKTFVYLPNSIWTMLKFLVAMMIATAVIKLAKDVVT